ncbi:hypothetical protein IO803_001478, partial [Campylobacter coli]|nr:hypothetical protein [Campylobacter coli]
CDMIVLDFILVVAFVLFMIFLIVGFNRQMSEKAKIREEKFKNKERKK